MNLEEVKDIFKPGTIGYFATTNGEQLELRGWQFQYSEGNKFYFGTANTKEVYKQMKANPQVAFAGVSEGYNVRLSGKAVFITDAAEKAEVFSKISKSVQDMYKTVTNPILELFYIEAGEFKINKGYGPIEVIKF